MLKRIATALWGKFESPQELKKFGVLAFLFGIIIGTYWTLRPMKDTIFNQLVGIDFQPVAKWVSLVVIVPLVIIYSKLIDKYPRHKVFYLLIAIYSSLAALFFVAFSSSSIGLASAVKHPANLLGWVWYVYVESFGSLIVALFWAIAADTTMPDSARRGFPIIALFGQMGNIFGPLLLDAKKLGFATLAPIVGICGILMVCMGLMLAYFMKTTPKDLLTGFHGKDEKETTEEPGFLEGLRLLLTKGYLFGIFTIIFVYEVIVTIIDYHFKTTVFETISNPVDANAYLNSYAIWTGIVATACVLLGINNIQRRLGITASLVMLPILVGVAMTLIKMNPTGLEIAFWIMVLSKAINYVLNQPTLKQLYIPTTKDSKYKAQAWIEMFGSRGSKASASGFNMLRKVFVSKLGALGGIATFLTAAWVMSGGLILVWLFVAAYVAKTYNKAIKEDRVVC